MSTTDKTVRGTPHIGLDNLSPAPGSHRDRKRIGRGPGSGTGKTSGKGNKGIKARSGHHGPGGGKPMFEGGQMPLTRRVPKRGFTNPFRVESQVVRLDALAELPDGAEVTVETLVAAGIIRGGKGPAKLLASGTVSRAFTVRGVKMSAGARERIVAAGGTVEE
jgi:large subunit ribosomal protein L15